MYMYIIDNNIRNIKLKNYFNLFRKNVLQETFYIEWIIIFYDRKSKS
jgi:hypothetical protein